MQMDRNSFKKQPEQLINKVPPQHLEAEFSVLGGLMLDSEALDEVADIIIYTDFYNPAHQTIYQTILDLNQKAQPIDLVTVTNALIAKNQLEQVGGSQYLLSLLEKVVSSANIEAHAKIIKEKSLLRKLISTSTHFIEKSFGNDFDSVESLIDFAEAEILKVGEDNASGGLTSSNEIVTASIKKIEELYQRKLDVTGVPTGFTELDKMTAGFHPGELIIIAARPSMGKTAFSLNVASHMALRAGKSVAYFSVEMGKESLMMRLLAGESRISMSELRTGRIQDASWPKLIQAAGTLSESKFFIDDTSGISPFEIRARCRRLKAQHGLDCIMIDYLQIMQLKEKKVDNREREISEISRNLKAIAKELQVPVIALAQLNRGVEGRADRRPMSSDLRESGSIEQDADVIMMLYRDDYYDRDDADKQGHAEVIIGKQRNGATGTVKMRFDAKTNKFRDADPEAISPLPPPQAPPPMPGQFGKPKNFAPGANK
ncbi:MAG: replicative DNA helicase [Pseudobdellovibrio sp.]|nr:replicative DNA helicase [Pseudobdellovibrio sp.]